MENNRYEIAQALSLELPSPLQKFTCEHFLHKQNIHVYCKRDDLIHATISGNKWRKLAPFVDKIKSSKIQHIISFGGGYSNHLHALGYICATLAIKLTVMIRGNYSQSLTPMLQDLKNWGIECEYLTKKEYSRRGEQQYIHQLQQRFQADLVIPEGGSHYDCLTGVAEIVNEYTRQQQEITHVVLPVASGGTMAGVIWQHAQMSAINRVKTQSQSFNEETARTDMPHIIGIGVLKGKGYLEELVSNLIPQRVAENKPSQNPEHFNFQLPKWHIEHDYHHGGYAKSSPELEVFIRIFENTNHIPIETVYSAKCFYALHKLISKQSFPENSHILLLHTGGLQGKR